MLEMNQQEVEMVAGGAAGDVTKVITGGGNLGPLVIIGQAFYSKTTSATGVTTIATGGGLLTPLALGGGGFVSF